MRIILFLAAAAVTIGCGDDDGSYDAGRGHADGVGNSCSQDSDCPTDNCYLGPAGGYCTSDCEDEGSTSQCPLDTVCKPIQGGQASCLLVCGSDHCPAETDCASDWCPAGSNCVSVSDSDTGACEPEP